MMSSRKRLVALGLGAALAAGVLGLAPQETRKTPIDNAQVARRLVNVCAGIRQGDLVLVNGGTRDVELLENIAIEIRKLGAHPIITLGSDSLTRAMFTDVPAKFDTQEPTFQVKLAETIDAFISIDFREQPDLLADIDSPRLAAHSKAFEQVHKTMLERGVVNVHLGNGLYPTASLARQFGISKSELSKIFWSGVNVDYGRLQNIGANVRTKLTAGRSMRITAPNGTDLTLQITERPVFVSDGVVSSEAAMDAAQISKVTQVVTSTLGRRDHSMALFKLATVLDWAGKFDEAEHLLLMNLELFGPQGEVHAQLGKTLAKKGKEAEALNYIQQALTAGYERPWMYLWLADTYRVRGNFGLAMKAYQDKLRLDGNRLEAHTHMGMVFSAQGDNESALYHFNEALRLKPDYLLAGMNLVSTLFLEGQLDEALARGQAILDSQPEEYRLLCVVGAILLRQGDKETAIEHFSKALRLAPDFKPAQDGLEEARKSY